MGDDTRNSVFALELCPFERRWLGFDTEMASLMLTLDDFALPFVYSPGQWTVPDTSAVSYVGTTYHSTTFPNASVALNFTGPFSLDNLESR